MIFRGNETTLKRLDRQEKSADYMAKKRENETDSEYNRRMNYQRSYRAKDNKSLNRRAKNLSYLSSWKKSKYKTETFHERKQRLRDKIDQRNWKEQYTK